MKLYAPSYYKQFRCIADKCEHSCCVGWEIDIDQDTLQKYKNLDCGYKSVIADSISMDGTPHFKLDKSERCPHLNECGLCEIILNIGEDHLCDICREHPRFYNFSSIAEMGIGASCPEAARVILDSPNYNNFEHIGEIGAQEDGIDFDARSLRDDIYEILKDGALGYQKRLEKIYSVHSIIAGNDSEWLEKLSALEYLDPNHKNLFMKYSCKHRSNGTDEYSERFLAYLIYRHCTESLSYEDFRERLSFCLFCERLLSSTAFSEGASSLYDVARIASIISEEIEYSDDNTFALMY